MAGGPVIPRAVRSGNLSWMLEKGTAPASVETTGRATIAVALQTKSQTEPLNPVSGVPQASQSSIAVMPSAVIIPETMTDDPAELATAPAAKAVSARMQKKRASKIMTCVLLPC